MPAMEGNTRRNLRFLSTVIPAAWLRKPDSREVRAGRLPPLLRVTQQEAYRSERKLWNRMPQSVNIQSLCAVSCPLTPVADITKRSP